MDIQTKISLLKNYLNARKNNGWIQLDNLNQIYKDVLQHNSSNNSVEINSLLEELKKYVTPDAFTYTPTQEVSDKAAGIDGREYKDANESAEVFATSGFAPMKPIENTVIPTQEAADKAAGIDGREYKDANSSADVFAENGFSPIKEVETTFIPTQEAADKAAGIDGREYKDAAPSAQAFIDNGPSDFEKELASKEEVQTIEPIPTVEEEKKNATDQFADIIKQASEQKQETLNEAPNFSSPNQKQQPINVVSNQQSNTPATVDNLGNLVAPVYINKAVTNMQTNEVKKTEEINLNINNNKLDTNTVETTVIPTQEAADKAAGIDGREYKNANESADVFAENGFPPMKPIENTVIPTQEAADKAAGIDGREYKEALPSAQAFIDNGQTDFEKSLEPKLPEDLLVTPPVSLENMPDHFITDTPEEKANQLLSKIENKELEKPDWAKEYEKEIKQDSVNDSKDDEKKLIPVVIFRKSKDILKNKTVQKIAVIAASVILILALAHGCERDKNISDSQMPEIDPSPSVTDTLGKVIPTDTTDLDKELEPVIDTPEVIPTPEIVPDVIKPPIPPTEIKPGGEVLKDTSDLILRTEENIVREDNKENEIIGNTTVLDELGKEINTPSGEYFSKETDKNTVIIDSKGDATYIDINGESVSLGKQVNPTQRNVTLPDGSTANSFKPNEVSNVAQTLSETYTPEVSTPIEVPAATVVTQEVAPLMDTQVVQGGLEASSIDLPDANTYQGDTNYKEAADAMVNQMVNNPTQDINSSNLGK